MLDKPNTNEFDATTKAGSSGALVPIEGRNDAATDLSEFGLDQALDVSGPSGGAGPGAFSVAMLLRTKWWILGVFVLVSGVTLPCIWSFVPPQYRARASIRISPVVSRIVFKTEDNGFVPLFQSYLNTQVSIILGPTVLQRVLDRDDVRQTRWYREPPHKLLFGTLSPLERLRKNLTVTPRRLTELIDVSIVTEESKDAKLIVDAVVDTYKAYTDETLRQNDIRRLETLIRERDALQKEIGGLVATKFRLTTLLGTADPETYRVQLSAQLGELESENESLKRDRSVAQWESNRNTGGPGMPGSAVDATPDFQADGRVSEAQAKRYSTDSDWRTLNLASESAKHRLAMAGNKYGELHPRIRDLSSGVQHAERILRDREYQLDEEWLANQFPEFPRDAREFMALVPRLSEEDPQEYEARLVEQISLLTRDIDRKRTDLMDAGEIAKEVAHYDEELRYKRELYETVRLRLTAFEMESKAPARIAVADYAVQPSAPFQDRRILLSAMALVAALMCGIGVGYLRGTIDPRIHETEDVQSPIQVPFLGKLPLLPNSPDLISVTDPMVTESIRMVRTSLLKRLDPDHSNVVLITSSSSRAGKTSVALLLARSLAQLGKKTLLVETDLRRPSIAKRMNFEADTGLAAVLTGTIQDEEVIIPTPIARFDVLPAGLTGGTFNFELLANGVFASCLKRWKRSYDFVVLDSPPVFPVADARILASQVDGTIMVLRSAHCRRADVFQAYADLLAGGGRVLGTVFIGAHSDVTYSDYAEGRQYLESVRTM